MIAAASMVAASWCRAAAAPAADTRFCGGSAANGRAVAIETVQHGVWKGSVLLSTGCGAIKGDLLFSKDHDSLRYMMHTSSGESLDARRVPMSLRTGLLRVLVTRILETFGRRPVYSFATASFPEFGSRLAAAAVESNDWDRRLGRPRVGKVNDFARRLMIAKNTCRELTNTIKEVGYSLEVAGTEDILVLPFARMTPADREFIEQPVLPSDKLPVSATVYFRMSKLRQRNRASQR